jgi:hypothetical protein
VPPAMAYPAAAARIFSAGSSRVAPLGGELEFEQVGGGVDLGRRRPRARHPQEGREGSTDERR